jgi:hypothetical protein
MINQSYTKTVFESLPLDIWFDILGTLNIQDAISLSKADPRTFGAFIEDKQVIRFNNAFNTAPSPLFHLVLNESAVGYTLFSSWLDQRLLKSCIISPNKLFRDISKIIALKDRGFVATTTSLSDWVLSLMSRIGSVCVVSWKLLFKGSLFGFDADDFHQACDGMGNCVVVVRAENGRIAAAYNGDGFSSFIGGSSNLNGFIVSIENDGSIGAQFDRNNRGLGIYNFPDSGPVFGNDLFISSNCHQNEDSCSMLGSLYGERPDANETTLFKQEYFRMSDYEVFKIVIE